MRYKRNEHFCFDKLFYEQIVHKCLLVILIVTFVTWKLSILKRLVTQLNLQFLKLNLVVIVNYLFLNHFDVC